MCFIRLKIPGRSTRKSSGRIQLSEPTRQMNPGVRSVWFNDDRLRRTVPLSTVNNSPISKLQFIALSLEPGEMRVEKYSPALVPRRAETNLSFKYVLEEIPLVTRAWSNFQNRATCSKEKTREERRRKRSEEEKGVERKGEAVIFSIYSKQKNEQINHNTTKMLDFVGTNTFTVEQGRTLGFKNSKKPKGNESEVIGIHPWIPSLFSPRGTLCNINYPVRR
uniref:Uncharacterized protein LOC110209992 n=1 Tax=Phascolarctos cinereus TaxID=38626 RepID=A0A6P5KIM0_PHACI|nr:uncharacterized protein LOC110209992 [Phascolarctos cinereus]